MPSTDSLGANCRTCRRLYVGLPTNTAFMAVVAHFSVMNSEPYLWKIVARSRCERLRCYCYEHRSTHHVRQRAEGVG